MNALPELPRRFQDVFESAKATAELEYAKRAERFPHQPQFAGPSLHRPILIQTVFFAYCTRARNACRAGDWTAAQVSRSVETAWPAICGFYVGLEHGACSEQRKLEYRDTLWQTVTNDRGWKEHLSDLKTLAEGGRAAPADPPECGRTEGAESGDESTRPEAGPAVSGPQGNRADTPSAVRHNPPPEPVVGRAEPFRFQVALSFPGGNRSRVERIAEALAARVGRERVLYDRWYQAEFARPNLDVYLPKLYHEQSLLLVFFLCAESVQKDWCGLEWRVARDLLKQKQDDRLMFLRLDRADILGLYSIDGGLDITGMPDDQVTDNILHRLALLVPKPASPHGLSARPLIAGPIAVPDPDPEFVKQLKRLPTTAILEKIKSKPRWRIWIRPTGFKKARFQSLDQCREFMASFRVRVPNGLPYPCASTSSRETWDEWIAGELDESSEIRSHAECWALFRSGQFVHNVAFGEAFRSGDRVHVFEILDTVTAAFELAARMAERVALSPEVAITFELGGVGGRCLTWPQPGYTNALGPNCWCQDEQFEVPRQVPPDRLRAQRRALALEVTLEICSRFGWSDPPRERLANEQNQRFGAVQ